ncbi:MAG: hypothetical protein CME61_01460 [Halobacteriovoraceae bacterium]|nr:hypothetical protein [Halobacteriovoraceae bacterium]
MTLYKLLSHMKYFSLIFMAMSSINVVFSYEEVFNQGQGKMQMIESIDKYLNGELKNEIKSLKKSIAILQKKQQRKSFSNQTPKGKKNYSADFVNQISDVNQMVIRNRSSIGRLERSLQSVQDELKLLRKDNEIILDAVLKVQEKVR